MSLALLLSGQGGQHSGMFDLTAERMEAQAIFDAGRPILGGIDPRDLARDGGEALHENRNGQILCCVAALAGWAIVEAAGVKRVIVAGYSIGDLAAWGIAGRFSPEAVLHLAAARAEAMNAASGEGFGLAGLRGLSLAMVEGLTRRHGCHLAIHNASDSFVVGGRRDSLHTLCREALGAGAQRAVVLPVHTPSHTPLLEAATDRFREAMARVEISRPGPAAPRLVSGLDGTAVFNSKAGLEKLALQISQPLDWAACLVACREYGVDRVLELGPGHALATMARDALPEAHIHALEDFRSSDGVIGWVQGDNVL